MQKFYFRTLLLFVKEVAPSVAFYEAFFQIPPIEQQENFASFRIENVFFNLHRADEKSPVSTGGSVGYFWIDDLSDLINRAIMLGALIWRGPLKLSDHTYIVQIQDPFGNIVGFEGHDLIQQCRVSEG